MRIALALGVLALVIAVPAAGSTPSAQVLLEEGVGGGIDLVTLDADGTAYRSLTHGDKQQQSFSVTDTEGSWSPDGSGIAFTSHRDSNIATEIYVMDADGSHQQRLTHDGPDGVQQTAADALDRSPAWSPLGNTIAYVKSVKSQSDIWLMKPDGSDQHALTADGGVKAQLSWSPDGTRLVYQRQDVMFVVGAEGGGPTALPRGFGPAWSPDGRRIAYASNDGLWTVRPDGTDPQRVTTLAAGSPSWSADGSQIVLLGIRSFPDLVNRFGVPTRQDVYVVGADGSALHRLTGPAGDGYGTFSPPLSGSAPTWWPDASRIFFSFGRPQGHSPTTYVMNADGSCEGRFAQTGTQLLRPQWRPGSQPRLGPIRCADLRLTIDLTGAAVGPAALGKDLVFRFDVDNDGDETATGVRVELKTEAPEVTISAPNNVGDIPCSGSRSDLVCTPGPVPPGASRTVAFLVRSPIAGGFPLSASTTAVEPDSDPSTNTISTGLQVLPCTIVGTYGDDVLYGTVGPDKICGLPGRDEVYGGKGNDYLDSGNGADIVAGGPGRDTILTKGGNDTIYARDGERDWIDCGSERDVAVVDRTDRTFQCETVVRPKR